MRSIKKLLCMSLTVVMLVLCLSSVAAAGNGTKFSDITDDKIYSSAVKTLNLMGVINGYEDGTFKPDQNVTRAEFTAMLMRTLKLGSAGSKSAAELPFTDIDDNDSSINWAIPNINTAYGMGVINGYEDGTFRPTANVAYEEAVKMIVCTLGYGADVDVSVTPWYSNYITIATQIGATKTASKIGSAETPASRACIAQLLYDSLEVKLVENNSRTDKTILNDYLGYTKCTGVIYSNDITSLSYPDINLRENEIQIYAKEPNSSSYELHTYNTDDMTLKNYIGYEVEFYYSSDGSDYRTLMFCVVRDTEPFKLNASNVEKSGSTNTQIKYYENREDKKEKSINLESDNVVIYNGKLYGSNGSSSRFDMSMIPDVGELTFIDSDNNGRYDVVEINAYEIYYVSSKAASTYEIIDNVVRAVEHPDDKTLRLDISSDRNLSIVNKNGAEVNFSSIAVGNIICVARSNGNGGEVITKAVVLTDKATGTVTARSDNKITISGKEYYYSEAAPWLNGGELSEPQMQDNGTYYLDINGDLVAYSKNAVNENVKYGYIQGYSTSGSFDDEAEFLVLTSTGTSEYIKTYKNTRINGETYATGSDVINRLHETARNQNSGSGKEAIQQLVKYSTRTSGGKTVFDNIYTAGSVDKGAEVVNDKLTILASVTADDPAVYNSSTKVLTVGSTKINVSSAKVISVPDDRSEYSDFGAKTYSSVFKNNGSYNVEVFDVSATNSAKIVVVYGIDNSQKVDSSSPVYVLKERSTSKDNMEQIEGYKSSGSSAKGSFTELVSDESDRKTVNSLREGDIFRAGTDKEGNTLIEAENIIYKVNDSNSFGIYRDNNEVEQDIHKAEFIVILGSVVARDDSSIIVVPEELSKGDSYDESLEQIFNVSDFDRARVLIYDNTDRELKVVEGDYESALSGLVSSINDSDPSKVLIYMSEGKIQLLCVLPQ